MINTNNREDLTWGLVIEALPNTRFRILLDPDQISDEVTGVRRTDDGQEMIAYLSGKMRVKRIRVIVGDRVGMEFDANLGGQARIVIRS